MFKHVYTNRGIPHFIVIVFSLVCSECKHGSQKATYTVFITAQKYKQQ